MKRVAVVTAIIFLTLALLAVAWQLRVVVLIFVISLVIAATLHQPIERFVELGLGRRLAILVVYLLTTGLVALLIFVVFMPILSETNLLVIDLTQSYNNLRFYISSLTGTHIDLLSGVLPTDEQFTEGVEDGPLSPALRQAIGMTQNVGGLLGQFGLAFVLSIYWTVDRTRFERLWLSLLAPEQRAQTRVILRRLTDTVGAYIRSELFQMIFAGALLTLGFWLIDLKYPFTAAMLAALAWLIPLVGGGIALVPVLLIGWLSDPVAMVLATVYTIAVLLVMEFRVEQRLFAGHRYWGVLVVFVMLALGSEFGLVGLIIAPPTAVALQILLDWYFDSPSHSSERTADLPALRQKLAEIEAQLAENPAAHTPRIKNLAARLKGILAESEAAYSAHTSTVEDSGNDDSAARESGASSSTEASSNVDSTDDSSAASPDIGQAGAVRTTQ